MWCSEHSIKIIEYKERGILCPPRTCCHPYFFIVFALKIADSCKCVLWVSRSERSRWNEMEHTSTFTDNLCWLLNVSSVTPLWWDDLNYILWQHISDQNRNVGNRPHCSPLKGIRPTSSYSCRKPVFFCWLQMSMSGLHSTFTFVTITTNQHKTGPNYTQMS